MEPDIIEDSIITEAITPEVQDPIIEVVVETDDRGITTETKTTTIVEVITSPSEEVIEHYNDEIANAKDSKQANLDQAAYFDTVIADYQQRIIDAQR